MQVGLKVTTQIEHLNITVMLEFLCDGKSHIYVGPVCWSVGLSIINFFVKFDIFSIDQSPEIAGKLNNYVLDCK